MIFSIKHMFYIVTSKLVVLLIKCVSPGTFRTIK